MKDVLFASFESLPFVKVGGLADVVYALPKAINAKKFKVKVSMPLFKPIKDVLRRRLKYVDDFVVRSGMINEKVTVYSYINESIEYLFIDNDNYFNRSEVYGYIDDDIRYSLFSIAVVEMMVKTNYFPDICHCHDYHTAMIPAICKYKYNNIRKTRKIKFVFTIHNLVYQGGYDKKILSEVFDFDMRYYKDGTLRFKDYCNFMKNAICLSDAVTTVSKTYAKEIQTKKYGYGLEGILKKNKDHLYGIVNGIDTSLFNPETDKGINYNFSSKNYEEGKKKNKITLQKDLGLTQDEDVLLIGMVSRLTFQKGADLIISSMKKILKTNVQIVILGTGEKKIEKELKMLSKQNKKKFAFCCGYNEALAHQIYASIDMLLMPSLFEPCGISQLISMRYGTLPLVRKTGGLNDTVINYKDIKAGNGFVFNEYNVKEFFNAYKTAYKIFYDSPKKWSKLVNNAFNTDVSFAKSAKEYEQVYQKVLRK